MATYTGIIARIQRAASSRNGNPAFFVTFKEKNKYTPEYQGERRFRTQTDAQVAYSIEDATYRGVPVTVDLTPTGHIFGIEVAEPLGERTSQTEDAANARRRAFIDAGHAVSLIGFDPSRNVYAFDVLS